MAYPVASINHFKFYCLAYCLLISLFLNAQLKPAEITKHSKSNLSLATKGKKALKDGDFMLAQVYYEALLAKKPESGNTQNTLARIYLKNRLYPQAEKLFAKSVDVEPSSPLFLAYTQILQGKYDEAQNNFNTFRKFKKYKKTEADAAVYSSVMQVLKQRLDKTKDTTKAPLVIRMNAMVNGRLSEFSPFYLNDSSFFFGKTVPDETLFYLKNDSVKTDIPYRKLFTGKIDSAFDVSKMQPWNFVGWNKQSDFGGACLSADGRTMYVTICDRKNYNLECHIYVSKLVKSGWTLPQILEGKINVEGFSSAQPTVGYDKEKKAEVLYFTSNRPGSKGFDIYYATFDVAKSQFVGISKCGPKINSQGNEYTPFYINKDSTLYFSSDGKGGFGGLDIFKAKGKLNNWSDAQPLPKPINSFADDAYFYLSKSGDKGFFTSNRNSESATEIKTCCEDIYAFTYNYTPTQDISPIVKQIAVSVPVKTIFPSTDTAVNPIKLTVSTLENGVKKIAFETVLTKSDTILKLTSEQTYSVSVNRENYLTETAELNLKGFKQQKADTLKLAPQKIPTKAIIIPGINYEFDSDKLTDTSVKIIDKFIYTILIDNPNIIFQINSHTDSKGDDNYNQNLSERRAKSVVDYLTQIKGIPPSRLRSKGFGEKKPIAPNTNADGSDNPEGRAQNRRTEFEVVGKLSY
jgi:outer membrane protein OmpA-like peptidoglycan-associated protein/tetratricopeptide (TPR) repeat protein